MNKPTKSKTDLVQSVVIGILCLLLVLSNFSLFMQFLGRLNPFASCRAKNTVINSCGETENKLMDANKRITILEFDRLRIEDASNLLLALQDYQLDNRSFPESLEALKKDGYLDASGRLADPASNLPYYYARRGESFILCIYLSDMIKGYNTAECSSLPQENDSLQTPTPSSTALQPMEQKLEIIGDAPYVNIREKPTTASDIVRQAEPGEVFIYAEKKDGWYRIFISGDQDGWVRQDYARPIIKKSR